MKIFSKDLLYKKQPDYIKDGLQVYYSGIDNTGNGYSTSATEWADLSGNNNTGKMYKFSNGSGENSGWTTNGLRFRLYQTNCGVVTINDRNMVDLFPSFPVTISCTYTTRQCNQYSGLFGNHGVSNAGFLVQYEGSNSSAGWLNGNDRIIQSSLWANNNSQHNLTLILMSTSRAILYIDGAKIYDKNTFGGYLYSSMLFTIGNAFLQTNQPQNAPTGRAFDGVIHNFLLYNRALTADEITHNYSIDTSRYFS